MQRNHLDPGFPRPATQGQVADPASHRSHRSLFPPQIPPQLESRVRRVWGRTRRGPGAGLGPPAPAPARRRVPALPYRGLGDVAALSDVLAVLLVGHTDPLLGDHLRGATCPQEPLGLALSPLPGRREARLAVPTLTDGHWAWMPSAGAPEGRQPPTTAV